MSDQEPLAFDYAIGGVEGDPSILAMRIRWFGPTTGQIELVMPKQFASQWSQDMLKQATGGLTIAKDIPARITPAGGPQR